MASANPHLFVFGMGYSARRWVPRFLARGWTVSGTARGEAKRAELAGEGIHAWLFDRDRPLTDPDAALAGVTHLLSSVPPDRVGDHDAVLDHHGERLAGMSDLAWAGYLSTTGVYGDHDGGWVDESSALHPTSERSERRAHAESRWRALCADHGVPVHIFRLAGIYGPGRGPFESIRNGTARRVEKPGHVFSRIHVEDIANTLDASVAAPDPGAIYNVCDDEPAPPQDVTGFACELLGVEPPPLVPFEEAEMSAMARTFWRDNKRVANTRLRRELGVRLAYPTYREGLRALAAA